MKNKFNLALAILLAAIVMAGCKKSDNSDPNDKDNGGGAEGISLAGKKVDIKTATYTYGGEFDGMHTHAIGFFSYGASDIPNFSKSASFDDVGTSFNFSIQSYSDELQDGTYEMDEEDENAPNIQFGTFIPGRATFEGSSVKGEYYFATDVTYKQESSGNTITATLTADIVPSSSYFQGDFTSNKISLSLKWTGTYTNIDSAQ